MNGKACCRSKYSNTKSQDGYELIKYDSQTCLKNVYRDCITERCMDHSENLYIRVSSYLKYNNYFSSLDIKPRFVT